MSFHFSLAVVLRYRETLKQREYQALGKIYQEIAEIEQQILQAERQHKEDIQQTSAELKRGTPAFQLHYAHQRDLELQKLRQMLATRLDELESAKRDQLQKYNKARQKHELLSSLREQEFDTYRRDDARKQQKATDDISLSRRNQHR
jgi:flagellar export protein FliJ